MDQLSDFSVARAQDLMERTLMFLLEHVSALSKHSPAALEAQGLIAEWKDELGGYAVADNDDYPASNQDVAARLSDNAKTYNDYRPGLVRAGLVPVAGKLPDFDVQKGVTDPASAMDVTNSGGQRSEQPPCPGETCKFYGTEHVHAWRDE